ncbi:MAG: DUF4397 domain-containing protein [Gemmatimonadaceae bacterium]|nr:DUF4397 domain-containing protein [Gemmatimonadaceae bacterium]
MFPRQFVIASALVLAACGSDGGSGPNLGGTRVRFVHAVADTGALDVRVNGALLPGLTGVPYGEATDYQGVNGDGLSFSVQSSPSTSADAPRPLTNLGGLVVQAGTVITLVASGDARDTATASIRAAGITAYRDDVFAPVAGQARLRVINASQDAGALDVYATPTGGALPATPSFAGVDFKSQTVQSVAAGSYTLTITPLADRTTVLATTSVALPDGGVQTVVIRGYAGVLPPGLSSVRRISATTMVNRAP